MAFDWHNLSSAPAAALEPIPGDDFDFASPDVQMARALYPYVPDPAGVDTEISFSRGEVLRVRNAQRARWWVARNEGGEVGMVPSNYLNVLADNEVAEMRRMGARGMPALEGGVGAGIGPAEGVDAGDAGVGGADGADGGAGGGPALSPMARRMQGQPQRPMWDRLGERASGWGWA